MYDYPMNSPGRYMLSKLCTMCQINLIVSQRADWCFNRQQLLHFVTAGKGHAGIGQAYRDGAGFA